MNKPKERRFSSPKTKKVPEQYTLFRSLEELINDFNDRKLQPGKIYKFIKDQVEA